MKAVLLALVLLGSASIGSAQEAETPPAAAPAGGAPSSAPSQREELTYERSWPEQRVPYFRIAVHPDGSGTYSTHPTTAASNAGMEGADAEPAAPVQELHISERNRAKIFAVAPAVRSPKGCQGGNSHTAQTGRKVLLLKDAGQTAQCSFNFSDDRRVEEAVGILNSIALTIEEGDRLNYLLRFDRLGLDAAMGSLLEDVQAGRALEVENLAPLLRKLQGDDALMTRVRERAGKLLELGSAGS